ncbi:peptide methionine sulfoxide reductase [Maribacter sp. 2304DJ31-5]|uniref:peptide methionine sulfoxide reductase n=1 Tax=Maribacter sp. 2304DJ31-5 TaxID=3386273 RepID=UPI0039BCE5F9
MILEYIKQFPVGYSMAVYNDKKYGVTRTDFNHGKSFKLFAKELGGNDFISLNYYMTQSGDRLKPCEMPEQKVIHFLKYVEITSNKKDNKAYGKL